MPEIILSYERPGDNPVSVTLDTRDHVHYLLTIASPLGGRQSILIPREVVVRWADDLTREAK